jgi:hypothetical protein
VDASHAYVVKVLDAVAHGAGGQDGFFGYGNVTGTGGDYEDGAFARDFGAAFDGDYAGEGMEFGGRAWRSFARLQSADGGEDFFVGAGDKDVVAAVAVAQHGADDCGDLLGSFAFAEDDFGVALAEGAVVVDFSEAQVFEGEVFQALDGAGWGEFARVDLFE